MTNQLAHLNSLSLFDFPKLFSSLDPPAPDSLRGLYRGAFVGPAWLRQLARPLLVITGLGGWWGKDFDTLGNAINLVIRRGKIERIFPMQLTEQSSLIDHRPGLALRYLPENPFPWPWTTDELRLYQPGIILGMTMTRLGPIKPVALPFVLQPQEAVNGF